MASKNSSPAGYLFPAHFYTDAVPVLRQLGESTEVYDPEPSRRSTSATRSIYYYPLIDPVKRSRSSNDSWRLLLFLIFPTSYADPSTAFTVVLHRSIEPLQVRRLWRSSFNCAQTKYQQSCQTKVNCQNENCCSDRKHVEATIAILYN